MNMNAETLIEGEEEGKENIVKFILNNFIN